MAFTLAPKSHNLSLVESRLRASSMLLHRSTAARSGGTLSNLGKIGTKITSGIDGTRKLGIYTGNAESRRPESNFASTTTRINPQYQRNSKRNTLSIYRRVLSTSASSSASSPSSSTMSPSTLNIKPPTSSDYDQWEALFRAYIAFYKSTIPESQYRATFNRLIDPKGDIDGLVLRDPEDETKLIGIAHFYSHQTPWSEGRIMHFNDLFIDPNIRGKGYGRAMILAVKERAKESGCFRLEWATKHDNPARKLYDQLATCDFVEYRVNLS